MTDTRKEEVIDRVFAAHPELAGSLISSQGLLQIIDLFASVPAEAPPEFAPTVSPYLREFAPPVSPYLMVIAGGRQR